MGGDMEPSDSTFSVIIFISEGKAYGMSLIKAGTYWEMACPTVHYVLIK